MGNLASFSLRNRAFVALSTVIVAIFGVISLGALKLELIPNLQFPMVGVVAPYQGASPEAVEQQVTVPVEAALAGVDGVETISSTSSSGAATVLVTLEYGTDLDRAQQQVETAVTNLRTIPESVEPVTFAGDFDQFPVVQMSVTSDLEPAVLAERLDQVVVGEFEDIEGVRDVQLTGAPTNRVEVTLKSAATKAGITAQEISSALSASSMVPAGSLDEGDRSIAVQVGSTPTTLAELGEIPVTLPEGGTRPLSELATLEIGQAPLTSYARTNGEPSLSIGVTKTPDGNTVEISNAIAELVPDLEKKLGSGAEFTVAFDQAPFIEKSVHDLTTEGGLGLIFAVFVILLFLHSLRSTLVTAISIPLSLLVTLIGLRLGGYSLNILTLGALTVAIGRVVDDSIVVIENIKRHLAYGEPKATAIVTAVKEVGGAITSSTIATAAVFLPIGVVGGQVGELFRPFAITVSLALLASLLVALTIIPVLAYWFLKSPETADDAEAARLAAEAEENDDRTWLRRVYDPVLRASLAKPWLVVALAFVLLLGTLAMTPLLKTNFLGNTGQNTLTVTQELEAGASLKRQDEAAAVIEKKLEGVDAIENVQTTVGGDPVMAAFAGGGTQFSLTLDEDADADAVSDEIRTLLEKDADGDISVSAGDSGFSSALEVVVSATEQENLLQAADKVVTELKKVDGLGEISSDAAPAQTVLAVTARAQAERAGLTSPMIGGALAQVLFQPPLARVTVDHEQLDVVMTSGPKPTSVEELSQLPVGPAGTLGQVAEVEETKVAAAISRLDGNRTVTITVDPGQDDLGQATADVNTVLDAVDLPEGTEVSLGGVAEDQAEAFAQLGLALLIAVAIVYMVMVGTFNSLVQPLILLVSVPFAATGALLLQIITGIPLGVASLIGALMLIGVVVTNAIVLIDLVNQTRNKGASITEALFEGGGKRLRPIVMTALATILALTPMGLGLTGGSAFISQPLAIVVIGGLISSTLLTLVLVPVLYLLVERRKERKAAKREEKRRTKDAAAAAPQAG